MRKLFWFAVVCLPFSACYYDNASELFPASALVDCDTTVTVTYDPMVKSIFESYCGTNNSCHSPAIAEGGVVLSNYNGALAVDTAVMVASIEHRQGAKAMPPLGKLSDCNIQLIRKWIQTGQLR